MKKCSKKTGCIAGVTFIAVCTGPAEAAGAVASCSITHAAITAVTALKTVGPKPAWRAA